MNLARILPRSAGRNRSPLNLAQRPFRNRRPVARTALLLAAAGAVLLAVNLFLYTGYVTTRRSNATELDRVESEIAAERGALQRSRNALAEADIGRQNELVTYLNGRIDRRTFGWSVLFDRLSALLPEDVRLSSLTPSFEDVPADAGRRRRGTSGSPAAAPAPSEPRVDLAISAVARNGEAVLHFIDALYADAAFEDPNLQSESLTQGEVSFQLSVVYLPHSAETSLGATAADAAAADSPTTAATSAPGDSTAAPAAEDGE